MLDQPLQYISNNKLLFIAGTYLVGSAILKAATAIDITIPCIWNFLFDIHCPGCGLTTSFINLIQFNFIDAFKSNPLIFIIIPAGVYFLKRDYSRFKKINPQ